ncbi:alpha/beta hydrolase [Actinoplanes sp. NPDC051633]|uniref:alpha/beta fold hydrolase n=1 Tax=Actinoplanes sp. NPDC051633 TaxID=3155670 RepID=UPI0034273EC5
MTEQIVVANGVELCVETFGSPADPAVLLIHGACASMLWWETELCERLAARGRYVIRYDNRDTGRSISYPPGAPGYTMTDLARDAVGILDVLGVHRAHIVGRSMSGGIALILGVDHPDRVASLTFVATTTGDDDLPPPVAEFPPYAENADYVVESLRAYAGDSPFFDAEAVRTLAEQDIARTRDLTAALTNHFSMHIDGPAGGGFGDLTAPVLVVHGDRDPMYPLAHGAALHAAVPGSRFLVLEGAGHDVPRPLWDVFVDALTTHTEK